MAKVLIIGAGLTGLSAAYYFEQNNFFDYEIIEQNDAPGGLLKSCNENGFTFDQTGHFLHISDPLFKKFIDDVLGFEKCNQINRSSYIYSWETYIPYPFQQSLGYLPKEVAFECLRGFVERKENMKNPKNFYQWVKKHFGLGFGEHFFFPYNNKLLNCENKNIMPSWTGRFVPDTSLRMLFDSLVDKEKALNVGYNSTFFYPKVGGINSLINALASKLKNKINLKTRLVELNIAQKTATYSDASLKKFDFLISTAPLPSLLACVHDSSKHFAPAIKNLKVNSVFNFNLGINKPSISDKHWVYFPRKDFLIYRLGYWHNFSDSMAPKDCSSIYGEYSFRYDLISATKLHKNFELAIQQVLDHHNLQACDVIFRKDFILKNAYVLYDAWREKNIDKIHQDLGKDNIFSIGRFGGWKYNSMQEAFLDGTKTAENICKLIRQQSINRIYSIFPS